MKTKYELCYEKTMDKYMKKYEKGELKDRSDNKIKSRKQAIAIALSMSNKKCEEKFGREDYKNIEEKFNKNMYDEKGNINEKKRLSYSTFKNGVKLMDKYKNEGKGRNSKKIWDDMILKVFMEIKGGNINKFIIEDIIKIMG